MKRVLIADDEPIERMIVSRTVEKYFSEELTVVSAANGREAVEQFFAGDCQIALLDIRVGDMVYVEKGGEIIPKITGVDLAARPADSRPFQYITRCPECGTPR